MVKLHTPCCLPPLVEDVKWTEALKKKFTKYATCLSATNLSFIPPYAFTTELKNVTVSSTYKYTVKSVI